VGSESRERVVEEDGDSGAEQASRGAEDERFGEQLTHQARPAGAEGGADGELAGSARASA
jgi:hypothetical protein